MLNRNYPGNESFLLIYIYIYLQLKMATKPKTCPPKFVEGMSYTSWKNKAEMWQLVTSVDKKEQAIVILLQSLEGHSKAEKAASELTAAELHNDIGMKVLFEKLDMVFKVKK